MKTNRIRKKILIYSLIAVIILNMQGPRVFAESLQPESRSEISAEQSENQPETTVEESVSQNDLQEEEQESQPETTMEESVSENDLSELQSKNQPVVTAEQTDADTEFPELNDDILDKCIVQGTNPPGVTVNLFDYWQSGGPSPDMEIAHDQVWGGDVELITYKMGISEGHLLRFGYTCVGCPTCEEYGKFGAWNDSQTDGPCTGIVKKKLGAYGFPELNLGTKSDEEFGGYNNLADNEKKDYLSPDKKKESLSYLFSPSEKLPDCKETYIDVQGLFQSDKDGYYCYDSMRNFASYNEAANSFILYNSPGVAEANGVHGQFFPFNTASDVFNTYTVDNGNYRLCYMNEDDSISIGDNSYLQCSATKLNHYLGMTLEFLFQQPESGHWSNGKPMTFEFSGDDDVWIFIDGVLVADLGGLHGACSLKIDFSNGNVEVTGSESHTLLDSFKDAYGEDSDPGGIAFRENTFADNTEHTLKMFYLERGHGASDLALKFNVLAMPDEPGKEDPPQDPDEPGKEDPPQDPDEPGKEDPPQDPDEPGKEDPPQDPDDPGKEDPPQDPDDPGKEDPPQDPDDPGKEDPPQDPDDPGKEDPPKGDTDDPGEDPPPKGDTDDPGGDSPPKGDTDDPGGDPPPNGKTDEYEESVPDIISVSDNHMVLDTTGIPQTGDDSLIGWLSVLCIMSLLGIGIAVYNLIFVKGKQKNHSSKQ